MLDRGAAPLDKIFSPRSIAVLGATEDKVKVGSRPIRLLQRFGYGGQIFPINAKRQSVFGLQAYPDLASLPSVPDLVIFAVPAAAVVEAARECAKLGVGAIIVYSSGFAEGDDDGRAMESQLRQLSKESGMLICGPNCQGVANFTQGMVANFTSALMEADVQAGPVALLAQSGLVSGMMLTACLNRKIGISYLVSTGNEAGFTLAQAIGYAASDPAIKVIAGYAEEIRDFEAFREAAEIARRHAKPIVLLKVGATPAAAGAARLHTASDTGDPRAYDQLFDELGIVSVETVTELVELTAAFAQSQALPRGRRVGILTNSGGLGVYSADILSQAGLVLEPFSKETTNFIRERLLVFGSAANPVDISTQAFVDPHSVTAYLERICLDPDVDIVSVTFGLQFLNATEVAEGIIRAASLGKPIFVTWMYSAPEPEAALLAAGIPLFNDPAMALRCAGKMAGFARSIDKENPRGNE